MSIANNLNIKELITRNYPHFFESELKDEMAEVGRIIELKPGETLITPNAYIKTIPLLISGTVRISRLDEDGNEIFLYYLNGSDTCAMSLSCCMADQKSQVLAVAEEDSLIIGIPVKYLNEWLIKYPTWKNYIFSSYRARFEDMLNTIDTIAFNKMDERLLKYLQQRTSATGSPIVKGTHQEIAEKLNTSREVISRLLKKMEKESMVRLSRNQIELLI